MSIVRFKVLLYSAGSGVNSVVVVFVALSVKSLSFVHLKMSFRYGCMSLCAVKWFTFVELIVMSSAYVKGFTVCGGSGRSEV